MDPLLVPQELRNVDVHPEGSVMDIHRVLGLQRYLLHSLVKQNHYHSMKRLGRETLNE